MCDDCDCFTTTWSQSGSTISVVVGDDLDQTFPFTVVSESVLTLEQTWEAQCDGDFETQEECEANGADWHDAECGRYELTRIP